MKNNLLLLFAVWLFSCSTKPILPPEELAAYEAEINEWHAKRIEELKTPDGWLNLAGLFWLDPGANSFGSSRDNIIIFPEGKIAERAGVFIAQENQVKIVVYPDAEVRADGKLITEQVIYHNDSANSTMLESGSLRWSIIKRDKKIGVRLRDMESELLKTFTSIDRFPIDPSFRVEALFKKADSQHTIDVINIIGQVTPQLSPGTLEFDLDGDSFSLDVLEGNEDEYFIVFGDETTGNETYGGGRFLYVKKPDANGKVVLDFNKAYNPPCVFTPYATCPLPPKQNVLDIKIKAGEKNVELAH